MNPMRRSAMLFGLAALSPALWGQAPARIAWVFPGSEPNTRGALAAFKQGMAEQGLHEGRQYLLDQRFAEGHYERFPALIESLLKQNPVLLLAVTIASVRAAQQATQTVPIVFVSTNDPVGAGIVSNLARPGGNTTGLSSQNEDLVTKYVELLHEALPRARSLALLSNPANLSNPRLAEVVRAAALKLGLTSQLVEVSSPGAMAAAFDAVLRQRPDALVTMPDAMFTDQRDAIAAFGLQRLLPVIAQQSEMVAAGCLLSYGASRPEIYRRAATYVKRILDGAKPGDLPVEQPTRFELIVNLKTAKALGIVLPQALLLRADEVIQ